MPLKESCAIQEPIGLINDLSAAYGVSRKTVNMWIERFKEAGFAGLANRPSARLSQHLQTSGQIVDLILAARKLHATWDPKKQRARLERKRPSLSFPAASTIGDTLKRAGFAKQLAVGALEIALIPSRATWQVPAQRLSSTLRWHEKSRSCFAPWHAINSEHKWFGRVSVLETCVRRLCDFFDLDPKLPAGWKKLQD